MTLFVTPIPKPTPRPKKQPKRIARKSRPSRVRRTARGREQEALNVLFSRVIRTRDPWCLIARCRYFEGSTRPTSDAAHLFGKGAYPRIRWDLRNAVGACRQCHDYMGSHKAEWEAFMRARLNVQDWEDLMRLHFTGPKPDRSEVRKTLTAELRRLS